MNMEELEVIIDKDGNVKVQVKGIKGELCLDATKRLEEALGFIEEREFTEEYYQQPTTVQDYEKERWRKKR